tara:strand:- start:1888 stop:3276 length:1389 start_codon:yes stop_codon:yes gene_type:complete
MTAQEVNFSNFFETTLNGIVAGSATAMTLTEAPTSDGSTNIEAPYYLVIDPDSSTNREIVEVTASSGTTITTMTRDIEGRHLTDPDHADGTTVRMSVIKEMFEDVHDRIDGGLVNKNLFRNGNCLSKNNSEPAAGSITQTSSYQQAAIDCWYTKHDGSSTVSVQEIVGESPHSADDRPFDSPHRALNISSSGNLDTTFVVQPIAQQPLLYRRTMTLSCWFKSDSISKPKIKGHFSYNYQIGDTSSGGGELGTEMIASNTWQQFKVTFQWDPGTYGNGVNMSSFADGEEGVFGFKISQGTGTGGSIKLTGMKLELGSVATRNVEVREEETAKCEKFLKRYGSNFADFSNDCVIATGVATSTTTYKVFMPATPMWTNYFANIDISLVGTLEVAGVSSGHAEDITTITIPSYGGTSGQSMMHSFMIEITGAISSGTFTAGEFVELRSSNNRGFIQVDAESALLSG